MLYDTKRWELKREAILRRDKYQCQECKRYGKIRLGKHVHHVYPREIYPEYQWSSWNLITLCQECHNSMHDRDTHELSTKGEQLKRRIAKKYGVENRVPG